MLTFRAPQQLADRLDALAASRGLERSEMLRQLVVEATFTPHERSQVPKADELAASWADRARAETSRLFGCCSSGTSEMSSPPTSPTCSPSWTNPSTNSYAAEAFGKWGVISLTAQRLVQPRPDQAPCNSPPRGPQRIAYGPIAVLGSWATFHRGSRFAPTTNLL